MNTAVRKVFPSTLLSYRLFIRQFLWFPIRSAYIFIHVGCRTLVGRLYSIYDRVTAYALQYCTLLKVQLSRYQHYQPLPILPDAIKQISPPVGLNRPRLPMKQKFVARFIIKSKTTWNGCNSKFKKSLQNLCGFAL